MKNVQTQLQNQKGFTLVEIAIVLVIIGLLLGGVLKGQELIENAKIKAVTSDFDGISAAYYAYKDRTGNFPGEGAVIDGIIDENADPNFWQDLRSEGFISGLATDGTGPDHDLSGLWSAEAGAANGLFTKNHICATNIPESFAAGIDTKLDDGDPANGNIRTADVAGAEGVAAAYDTTSEALVKLCKEL